MKTKLPVPAVVHQPDQPGGRSISHEVVLPIKPLDPAAQYVHDHPRVLDSVFGGYHPSDFERLGRHVGEQRKLEPPTPLDARTAAMAKAFIGIRTYP